MAQLAVATLSRAGVDTAGVAAAGGGDKFPNDGKTYFRVVNGGGSPINVTQVTPSTSDPDGLAITDAVVAVPAGEAREMGPFPPGFYNDTDGNMNFTYSAVTSVTVKALRRP